jgi:shikimate kinase
LTASEAATPAHGPVVVLIGSPGAGKTSVGRRVAEALGVPFADTDQLVEAASGMSVSDIFITHGEEEFRRREAEAVAAALQEQSGVVSLGGGAVMREETRERLRGSRVVWLRVSLADAAHRVGMNTARPLLLGNVRATLSGLLDQRNPVYEDVATDIVDTSGRNVRDVTDAIVGMVRGG